MLGMLEIRRLRTKAESELGQAFESVWLGSMTAEQALDRVQERMEEKWAEYLRIRDAIRRRRAS